MARPVVSSPIPAVVKSAAATPKLAGAMNAIAAIVTAEPVQPEQQPPQQSSSGLLEGIVLRADSSLPLAGAEVFLFPLALPAAATQPQQPGASPTRAWRSMVSSASGTFEFAGVPPGDYLLEVRADGFEPERNLPLTVSSDKRNSSVKVNLTPLGTIRGRVRRPDGEPAANVVVEAVAFAYTDGVRTLSSIKNARTDDRGEYSLFYLNPGQYLIRCVASATRSAPAIAQTYYPGVTDWSAATSVAMGPGINATGINFQLREPSNLEVRGKVIVPVPEGITWSATLYLDRVGATIGGDDTLPVFASSRPSGPEAGTFAFRAVAPGTYRLFGMFRSTQNGVLSATMPVEISDRTIDDLVLTLSAGVEVKGRVTVVGSVDVAQVRLALRPVGIPRVPAGAQTREQSGATTFSAVPPGDYHITVSGIVPRAGVMARQFSPSYVADIRQGARSINDTGILSVGGEALDFEVIVGEGGGKIEGVARTPSGPAVNAKVTLIPDSPRRKNVGLFRDAITDSEGRFSLSGVAPGNYKLFAWDNIPNTAEQNADFLAPYESKGVSVSVLAGIGSVVTLQVIDNR